MNIYSTLFTLLFFGYGQTINNPVATTISQDDYCAINTVSDQLFQNNPAAYQRHLDYENSLLSAFSNAYQNGFTSTNFTLPVVFHVIHEGGPENIPDTQIQQALNDLNAAFENTGYYDQGTGVNTNIEFCMATQTPDGEATDGINRVFSDYTTFFLEADDITVKDLSRWDPLYYINIWVVDEICTVSSGCGVAGYAYLPSSHGEPEDGIVVEANFTGSSPANSSVLIHEMGHYLGLYHTFQGGCQNDNCMEDGDRVCDTPPDQSTAAVDCSADVNTCSTDSNSGSTTDQNDMFWNYMDYGDLNCYSAFTQGQSDRMCFSIENSRGSLINSPACLPPCPQPVEVSITATATSLEVGESVTFTATSINAANYQWYQNGMPTVTSDVWNTSFAEEGIYKIIVDASNSVPGCIGFDTLTVEVLCPVNSDFTMSTQNILIEESVSFTNVSTGATTYEWYVNSVLESSSQDFIYTFNSAGFYNILLKASNGLCDKYSNTQFVIVADPCDGQGITQLLIPQTFNIDNAMKTNDGGYAILGESVGSDDFIIKIDQDFQVEWTKYVDWQYYYHWDVIQDDADDGLIITGYRNDTNDQFQYPYVIKLDSEGNHLWTFHLDTDIYSSAKLIKLSDGNFIIAGSDYEPNNTTTYLLKFDSQGNTIWFKGLNRFRFQDIIETTDGGFYVSSHFEINFDYKPRALLVRLDTNGDLLWRKYYHYDNDDTAYGFFNFTTLTLNDVGGVNMGFTTQPFNLPVSNLKVPMVISTDDAGEILWCKMYQNESDPLGDQRMHNMKRTPTGDYMMIIEEPDEDEFIFHTINANGDLISKTGYEDLTSTVIHGFNVFENESMALCARTAEGGVVYLMDSLGNAGTCNVIPVDGTIITDVPMLATSYSFPEVVLSGVNFIIPPMTDVGGIDVLPLCGELAPQNPDAYLTEFHAQVCSGNTHLTIQICNEGTEPLPAIMPISFYESNPTLFANPALATIPIDEDVQANACTELVYDLTGTYTSLFAVVNDDASLPSIYDFSNDFPVTDILECEFYNNINSVQNINGEAPVLDLGPDTILCADTYLLDGSAGFSTYTWQDGSTAAELEVTTSGLYELTVTDFCGTTQTAAVQVDFYTGLVLDLGPDQLTCENGTATFIADDNFVTYTWQDGYDGAQYTAWQPGTYWVEVTDGCAQTLRDTVVLTWDITTGIDLGGDAVACEGELVELTVTGYDSYQWYPVDAVDCDTCSTVNVTPGGTIDLIVYGASTNGCISGDTISVSEGATVYDSDSLLICQGDTLLVHGMLVWSEGNVEGVYQSSIACDSIQTTWVYFDNELLLDMPEDVTIPFGESVLLEPNIGSTLPLEFLWEPPIGLDCATCSFVNANPTMTTLYTFTVSDSNGCTIEGDVLVTIDSTTAVYDLNPEDFGLYIPNAFSPNDDGNNDHFYVYSNEQLKEISSIKVFDVWGELVYYCTDCPINEESKGWNGNFKGKPMNPGVFLYEVKTEFWNGDKHVFVGDLLLLR